MITFFTYVFYSFAVLFIIWELFKIVGFNPSEVIKNLKVQLDADKEYNAKVDAAERGDELYLADKKWEGAVGMGLFGCGIMLIVLAQWAWLLTGLTTSQWLLFLILIAEGFAYTAFLKVVGVDSPIVKVTRHLDSVFTICVLMFILINRFQLGWTV